MLEVVLVTVLAIVALVCYIARTDFHLFPLEDVQQSVVAAREFAAGYGMTSRIAEPPMLVFLARTGHEQPPWPNALRAPLPVIVMGTLMRVGVPEPLAVALSSGIFFVLAVPLLYALGFRLAGRPAAILAATAFTLSPSGLYLGATGLSESSTIAALAAIVLLMLPPISWRAALGAGIIAGIGYLGRSTLVPWALVMAVYLLLASREAGWLRAVGRVALLCVPLALAIIWWGMQMKTLSGEFGYSAQDDISIRRDIDFYPGRSSSLTLESWKPVEFIRAHPAAIARKYASIATATWPGFITMGGLTLLNAFFLAELLLVLARGKPASVHWLVYGVLALQLALVPLASFGEGGVSVNRYLDPLGPIAATLGAGFAIELLRRHHASMRLAMLPLGLIVALTAAPTAMDLAVGRYHAGAQKQIGEVAGYLLAHGTRDDIVASTHDSLIAWATGMYAVGLPITPGEFLRMDRDLARAEWVYIQHRAAPNRERTTAWEPIMAGTEKLPGFELAHRFPDGGGVAAAGEVGRYPGGLAR